MLSSFDDSFASFMSIHLLFFTSCFIKINCMKEMTSVDRANKVLVIRALRKTWNKKTDRFVKPKNGIE